VAEPDVPPSREVTNNPPLSPTSLRWKHLLHHYCRCRLGVSSPLHRPGDGTRKRPDEAPPRWCEGRGKPRPHDTMRTTYGVMPPQRTGEIFTNDPDCGASSICPSPRYNATCWLALGP